MHNSSCAQLSQQVNSGEGEGIHISATQVNLPAKMCYLVRALNSDSGRTNHLYSFQFAYDTDEM